MAINQEILNIIEAIKQAVPAERIYLFGSHAYGIPTEHSDYDFFMVIPDDGVKPLEAMKKARRSLRAMNRKISVDILANYSSEFEKFAKFATLERKIKREGVVLYEKN